MASNLLVMTSNLLEMASNLRTMASNLRKMASNLLVMTSNLLEMASNLLAMASNLRAMASNLLAMASNLLGDFGVYPVSPMAQKQHPVLPQSRLAFNQTSPDGPPAASSGACMAIGISATAVHANAKRIK